MNILLIPDKFKGSLSAQEVVNAITRGIQKVKPTTSLHSVLASDGGDGFLNAILENTDCDTIETITVDPLGRKIRAPYLFDPNNKMAYIELAKASGLELLSDHEQNPLLTSTYGTGPQIKDAISRGAKSIYLGLGGSATNDAGIGIATALGFSFLDKDKNVLEPIGGNLYKIRSIDRRAIDFPLDHVSFYAVNDVDNPLYGTNGAAFTYAGQKGADQVAMKILDDGLRNLNEVVNEQLHIDIAEVPGSGAAGGTAYGLKAFFNATFVSGVDFILNLAKVEQLLSQHQFDYIITGEGKLDNQTLHGKLIKGVVDLGNRYGVKVMAVCGQLAVDNDGLDRMGLYQVIETRDTSKPLSYNLENAAMLVEKAIFNLFQNN